MADDDDLDKETLNRVVHEVASLTEPMWIGLQPQSVIALVSVLQVALRHPEMPRYDGPALHALQFIEHARDYFADCPSILAVIDDGDTQ